VVPILLLLVSLLRVSTAVQQALSPPHALRCVSGEDCGSNSFLFVGSVTDAGQSIFFLFFSFCCETGVFTLE